MERAMLEKNIKWAMDRVSTDTLMRVYIILNRNIDFTMGTEQPTVRKTGNSRIYDRLLEKCHPIEVSGVSRRRKEAAARYPEMREYLGI